MSSQDRRYPEHGCIWRPRQPSTRRRGRDAVQPSRTRLTHVVRRRRNDVLGFGPMPVLQAACWRLQALGRTYQPVRGASCEYSRGHVPTQNLLGGSRGL